MSDGRKKRKIKVVPFIAILEKDRKINFNKLIEKAKMLKPEGLENLDWDKSSWIISSGRLVKLTGKNTLSSTFNFCYSPSLGGNDFIGEWDLVAKTLFILRFHRKNQATPNQRNFITAIGYVAYYATKTKTDLVRLTPEIFNKACRAISKDYSESTAYNLHKAVAEFAGHCDANKLCSVLFKYKYSKMKRPDSAGGVGFKRLDDPTALETSSEKLIDPQVFRVLGELYQYVPKDHKYRFYVLVLTLLLCTGRRLSELTLLPYQELKKDIDGQEYLNYFPRKTTEGDAFTPMRKLFMPKQVLEIVRDVIPEINDLCEPARDTANEIYRTRDIDLRFLSKINDKKRLYYYDLEKLGLSPRLLAVNGWIRQNNLSSPDPDKITKQGRRTIIPMQYTDKKGVIAYCRHDFKDVSHRPVHIDQNRRHFYLKDLMLVKYQGLSSGTYSCWNATGCTHSMLTTFLRYLPALAKEYASEELKVDFVSHHFRHTLNTLLDEGGLSELMQTEWFGRKNPVDTKAYQHTSREKRMLMIREDIKKGRLQGQLVDQINAAPICVQDAIAKARIQATLDVGTGICVHNFSQLPCNRHLQCSADCKDYLWVKDDKGRLEELKRQHAFTTIARITAEKKSESAKPKKSIDWLVHNDKKLKTLNEQLYASGVEKFNPNNSN